MRRVQLPGMWQIGPEIINGADQDVSASGSVGEEGVSCSGSEQARVALVRIGETQLDVLPIRLRLTAGAVLAGAVQRGSGIVIQSRE